jgi:hypothetical protein
VPPLLPASGRIKYAAGATLPVQNQPIDGLGQLAFLDFASSLTDECLLQHVRGHDVPREAGDALSSINVHVELGAAVRALEVRRSNATRLHDGVLRNISAIASSGILLPNGSVLQWGAGQSREWLDGVTRDGGLMTAFFAGVDAVQTKYGPVRRSSARISDMFARFNR